MTAHGVVVTPTPIWHRTTFQKMPVDIHVTPLADMTRAELANLIARAVAELRLAETAFTIDPALLRKYAVSRAAGVLKSAGISEYAVI